MTSKINFFIYEFLKDFRTNNYLPPRREELLLDDRVLDPEDLDEELDGLLDLALGVLLLLGELFERLTDGVLLLCVLGEEDRALELLFRLVLTLFCVLRVDLTSLLDLLLEGLAVVDLVLLVPS